MEKSHTEFESRDEWDTGPKVGETALTKAKSP